MTEAERFLEACAAADNAPREGGVGTLGQKTLHAVLKLYYEPEPDRHEVPLGRYVADVLGEDGGVVEVQTRALERLRPKLIALLPERRVTVVYPVAHTKWLSWVDGETGEVTGRRRSPKTGQGWEALPELGKLKDFFGDPGLRFRIPLIDLVEYRNLDGYGPARKRRATRSERIPVALHTEIAIDAPADFIRLVPPSLPEAFTAAEFEKAIGRRGLQAWYAMQALLASGAVAQVGTAGRARLYGRADAYSTSIIEGGI